MGKLLLSLLLCVSATLAEQAPIEVQLVIDTATSVNTHRLINYYASFVRMGYNSNPTLSDVKVGKSVHLNGIAGDALKRLGENAPVSSVIKPVNEWAVPLLLNSMILVMLRISKTSLNSKWHVGGYGSGEITKR